MSSSSPLGILAITVAAPGKHAALRAAQEKLVAETVKEAGCVREVALTRFDQDCGPLCGVSGKHHVAVVRH